MGIKLPDNFSGKELTKENIGLVRDHKTETGEHKTSRVTIEQIDDENLYFLNREFSDFALFYKEPVAENTEETPAEPAGSTTPTDPAKQEEENPSVSDEPEAQ